MIYHEGRPLLKFDCRDERVLGDLFREAESPAADELRGEGVTRLAEWAVTMLTGPVPNMGGRLFRHRKLVGHVGIQGDGFNCLFDDWRWGYFRLRDETGEDGRHLLVIDYDVISNGRFFRRMRDEVRRTSDPDVMLGRFNARTSPGRQCFLSYFTLTRIKFNGEK